MDNIILNLDPEDIAILKKGEAVCKDTDNPDLPMLQICKWDITQGVEDGLAEEEGLVKVVFESNGTVNKKRKKLKRRGEECLNSDHD